MQTSMLSSKARVAARPAVRASRAAARRAGTVQASASSYKMSTFNTWLLTEEREGRIDNELATVLSSIGTACKQIANLVQRAGISNLTGTQRDAGGCERDAGRARPSVRPAARLRGHRAQRPQSLLRRARRAHRPGRAAVAPCLASRRRARMPFR